MRMVLHGLSAGSESEEEQGWRCRVSDSATFMDTIYDKDRVHRSRQVVVESLGKVLRYDKEKQYEVTSDLQDRGFGNTMV